MMKTITRGIAILCMAVFVASCGGGSSSSSSGSSSSSKGGDVTMKINGLLIEDGRCNVSVTLTASSALMYAVFISTAFDASGKEIAEALYPILFRSKGSRTVTAIYWIDKSRKLSLNDCKSIANITNKVNSEQK